jgi:hypothetical protein
MILGPLRCFSYKEAHHKRIFFISKILVFNILRPLKLISHTHTVDLNSLHSNLWYSKIQVHNSIVLYVLFIFNKIFLLYFHLILFSTIKEIILLLYYYFYLNKNKFKGCHLHILFYTIEEIVVILLFLPKKN